MLAAFHIWPSATEQLLYLAMLIYCGYSVRKWAKSNPQTANTCLRGVAALILRMLR